MVSGNLIQGQKGWGRDISRIAARDPGASWQSIFAAAGRISAVIGDFIARDNPARAVSFIGQQAGRSPIFARNGVIAIQHALAC